MSLIVLPLDGKFQVVEIVFVKISLFELSSCTDKITPKPHASHLGACAGVIRGTGSGLHLHPTKVSRFVSCCSNASCGREGRVFLSVRRDEQRAPQCLEDTHLLSFQNAHRGCA